MSRFIRTVSVLLLALAGAAGFGLVTSCNITGGGPSGAMGGLNLLVTDAPTDEWEQVTVVLKSISLHRSNSTSWETVWTADPANPGRRHDQPRRAERAWPSSSTRAPRSPSAPTT